MRELGFLVRERMRHAEVADLGERRPLGDRNPECSGVRQTWMNGQRIQEDNMRSFSLSGVLSLLLFGGGLLGCQYPDPDSDATSVDDPPEEAMSPADQAAKLQRDVEDVLSRTPGARQISANEIELEPGVQMKLAIPGQAKTPHVQDDFCPFQDLCAWQDAGFTGHSLTFLTCGHEWNLGKYAFPGGGFWNDKISSIVNNQTSGTHSYFYNYTGNNVWARVLSIDAGHYLTDLSKDTAEGGGGLNDKIDGVHVCGSVPSPWRPNWP
jgi:hypothetical protein